MFYGGQDYERGCMKKQWTYSELCEELIDAYGINYIPLGHDLYQQLFNKVTDIIV